MQVSFSDSTVTRQKPQTMRVLVFLSMLVLVGKRTLGGYKIKINSENPEEIEKKLGQT